MRAHDRLWAMFSTFSLSLCPFDFRVAFSGSECLLLLSFLCALSGLLCSFPVMLCFQPLCCLVSFFCGFFFFLPSPSNAFPGPLTHFLLSGDFSRRRCGSLRAVQRRFAFPLAVYSISNHTQLPTERLHVPVFTPFFSHL